MDFSTSHSTRLFLFSPLAFFNSCTGLLAFSPCVDYTPAEYITLLFTDLGVLTPSAVSDELIRLYGEA